jgi:hypothetical protein
MKILALAALMIASLYATPVKNYDTKNNLAKRHSWETPPTPPGIPVNSTEGTNVTDGTDSHGEETVSTLSFTTLAYWNPYLNPFYVPVGSVVALPEFTVWVANEGDSILNIAYQFVLYSSYHYYGTYQMVNSAYLARYNDVESIYEPLKSGKIIRIPAGAGFLAYYPTTFDFISSILKIQAPHD